MAESVRVEGLKELERKLVKLGAVAGIKVLRGALMDAATPIVKAAKEKVPVRPGSGVLKKSIRKRSFVRKKGKGIVDVYVGPMRPKGWYGHLIEHGVEYGTSIRPAQPFLRPAFDQEKFNVVIKFSERLKERIDKAVRK